MNIGLIDVDRKKTHIFPNLALMKISSYYKQRGDNVEFVNYLKHYDIVYKSKIFTFSKEDDTIINADEVRKGGSGYSLTTTLPPEIDNMQPDYKIYGISDNLCYGFITRGCPNHCKWCLVHDKEGGIHPYKTIEEITQGFRRKRAILMDNNMVASKFGLEQLQIIAEKGISVDINQGIDARLVTPEIANLLAHVKWLGYIRLGCDTHAQIDDCKDAIELLRKFGYNGQFVLYTIINQNFKESYERIAYWKNYDKRVACCAQPFRDFRKINYIPQWQRDLARWANRRELYKTMDFRDYEPRRGFRCSEYFKGSANI